MRAEQAEAYFARGFNCAQAVFCAFVEDAGMDVKTAMKIASPLGGGIAHSGDTCGAVLGMCMALGLYEGFDTNPSMETKSSHNARVKALMDAFGETFTHLDCRNLRVVGDRSVCTRFVRYAAELTEKALAENCEKNG